MEKRHFNSERERLLAWANFICKKAIREGEMERYPEVATTRFVLPGGISVSMTPTKCIVLARDKKTDRVSALELKQEGNGITFSGEGIGEIEFVATRDILGKRTEQTISNLRNKHNGYDLEIDIDHPDTTVRDILERHSKELFSWHQEECYEGAIRAYDLLERFVPEELRHEDRADGMGEELEADELVAQIRKEQEEYVGLEEEEDLGIE